MRGRGAAYMAWVRSFRRGGRRRRRRGGRGKKSSLLKHYISKLWWKYILTYFMYSFIIINLIFLLIKK